MGVTFSDHPYGFDMFDRRQESSLDTLRMSLTCAARSRRRVIYESNADSHSKTHQRRRQTESTTKRSDEGRSCLSMQPTRTPPCCAPSLPSQKEHNVPADAHPVDAVDNRTINIKGRAYAPVASFAMAIVRVPDETPSAFSSVEDGETMDSVTPT